MEPTLAIAALIASIAYAAVLMVGIKRNLSELAKTNDELREIAARQHEYIVESNKLIEELSSRQEIPA